MNKKKPAPKPAKKRSHHKKRLHEPVLAVHVAARPMEHPVTGLTLSDTVAALHAPLGYDNPKPFEPGAGYESPEPRHDLPTPPRPDIPGRYTTSFFPKLPEPAPIPAGIPIPSLGNWFDRWVDKYQTTVTEFLIPGTFAAIILFVVVYIIIRAFRGPDQG